MQGLFMFLVFAIAQINAGTANASLIKDYVAAEATLAGVNVQTALTIVQNESKFNPEVADGDTHLICRSNGKSMRSRGIWQWNTCGHPDITDEQAYNVVTSTELAITALKEGKCAMWSTCPTNSP